jgi:osmoprotectant transport system permease protein
MNDNNLIFQYREQLIRHTLEHLFLVGISVSIAVIIGIPLGIFSTRNLSAKRIILGLANVFQTIPSLALFGFLIPVPIIGGIGERTAIVALILYSFLPIIRNTYTGIISVDPAIKEAGRGMGMTEQQLLFQVELPLALSFILAGIRVATVIGVGLATIAAAIGAGGLGSFIFAGVGMVNNNLILLGAIPAALMALMIDLVLGAIEHRLSSKVRTHKSI